MRNLQTGIFRNFLSEGLHFYPNDAKSLPIPKVTPEQQKPIVEVVDKNP